jgi:hypothetical protein
MSQFRSTKMKRPNFSQAEKEMIVRVFHGISNDFADLTKKAQIEKTAEYTGIDLCVFVLLYHNLIALY